MHLLIMSMEQFRNQIDDKEHIIRIWNGKLFIGKKIKN